MNMQFLWLIPVAIVVLWMIAVGITSLWLDLRAYKFITEELEIDGVDTSNYEVYYTVNSGGRAKPFLFELIMRICRK
jgi:hypothetical protein